MFRQASRSLAVAPCLAFLLVTSLFVSPSSIAETLYLEHARITQGDPEHPRVIEDGAILVEDGIIIGIGSAEGSGGRNILRAPAGVRRIDATGLHAVPAFIDAATTAGLRDGGAGGTPDRNASPEPDARIGPVPHMREASRKGLSPEVRAADLYDPSAGELDAHRRAGFGTLHVVPVGGYFSGEGAVVSLARRAPRESVIRDSTGIAAALTSSRPGPYPRSLMGILAHVRQFILDAAHHARRVEFHRTHPRGFPRPPRDTALAAMEPVLERARPLFFQVDTDNDIHRVLDLAREFQVEVVITGGLRARDALERLARESIRVIYSPDFGEKPELVLEAGALPLRVQQDRRRLWQERRETPLALDRDGISWTLASTTRKNPTGLLEVIRQNIEAGLPAPRALRQLTLGPAELLGVDSVLGSIEVGKIASIAFLSAPFESREAKTRYLLTDGELFEFELPGQEEGEEKKEEEKPGEDPAKDEEQLEKPEEGEAAPEAKPAPGQVVECELDEDRRPSFQTGGDLFIRNATVITLAGPDLPQTSIRVRQGKIEAIGSDLDPAGIESVIDATGWYVMPGIIDCHSHMATERGVNEATDAITCEVRLDDVVDPHDITIYRALAGGVTAAHLLHGSANPIGGQCRLIKLKYGRPASELRVRDIPQTVKFALGENVKHSNFHSRRGQRFPITRMGVEATFRRAFSAARDYEASWKAYSRALARGEQAVEPRRDLRLEALLRILEGDIQVHCHSYRTDEMLTLMQVVEEFGFRINTFQHVLDGYKIAPEIAAHGAGASTFSDWWAYKFEVIDAIPYNGKILHDAGVVTTFNSDDDELVRRLFNEASKATRYGGVPHREALKFVTTYAARQLMMEDRAGTIEVGKDADLAIFDADPLSVYARCRATIIEGEIYYERRDEARRAARVTAELPPARDFLPPPPPESESGVFAIREARLQLPGGRVVERGTVVVSGGKIEAIGGPGEVKVPAGATIIEGRGLHVYPGFIDGGTHLGLVEINSVRGTVDLGETGSFQPDLRMTSAVNVHSELIPVARATGITTAAVFNNTSGIVGGQAGVIRLAGRSNPEVVIESALGLQINIHGARREGDPPGWIDELKDWWSRARRYHEARQAGREVSRDERLEALEPYLSRKLPVIFSANGEPAMRLAVSLIEELELRGVIRGGRDAWKIASLLKEKEIPVIVGPVHASPSERHDPTDAPFFNAARLHEAGVKFAFQSADDWNARNLPFQVGTAVAYGLPHAVALDALTIRAAEILGIEDRTGSLETGKWADLVITDGDPLEILTQVHHLFIRGEPVSLESRHTRLYREFRDRTRLPASGEDAEEPERF